MQKLEIQPENIADILCDYLKNAKTVFVFPTDTVMNSWIDWIVMNPDKSGMDAVAFERFCAWDTFKGKYIQAKKEGYTVIPSILRKFFVSDLIARNAAKAEKERLQVIINPENEYAENAASFENWIEKNLSSLNFWKKRIDENAAEYGELDAEDKDYLYIYNEYCNFLETNRLFEPAWVEPDSFEAGQNFVIFFPELLEDFCDFENIFSAAENIILCTLAKDVPAPKAYRYEDSRSELRQTMLRIIDIAESGRPGPVLIDVPHDVFEERCSFSSWAFLEDLNKRGSSVQQAKTKCGNAHYVHTPYAHKMQTLESLCAVASDLFAKSGRAVLFCGGGAVCSKGAPALIQEFSRKFSVPVCTSLMGLTAEPYGTPLFCGMVGLHGSCTANKVMHESDLIIAVGVRFDDRATGIAGKFCPDAKIIHIDIDAAEINKIYQSSVAIPCDAAEALAVLLKKIDVPECKPAIERNKEFWQKNIPLFAKAMKGIYPKDETHPAQFLPRIEALYSKLNGGKSPYVTADVGQHQMFVAQCFPFRFERQFLTSGSLGTMGFGLPAALGAALQCRTAMQCKDSRVLCFSGDGSILMNIQELATLAEQNLDVTVFVLDNGCLGMVRQQQEVLYSANYSGVFFSKQVDFVAVAEAFGIKSFELADFSRFDEIMVQALSGSGPRFVHIPLEKYNVLPFAAGEKAEEKPKKGRKCTKSK